MGAPARMSPVGTTHKYTSIVHGLPERLGSHSSDRAYATGPLIVSEAILFLHDTPPMKLFSKNLRRGLSSSNEVPADGEQAAQLVRLPRTPAPRACIGTPTPDRKKGCSGREFKPNQGPRVTGLSGTACGFSTNLCQIDLCPPCFGLVEQIHAGCKPHAIDMQIARVAATARLW